jgi:hypothetical protein
MCAPPSPTDRLRSASGERTKMRTGIQRLWSSGEILVLVAVAAVLGGCATEVQYQYRSRLVSNQRETPREVTETPTYTQAFRSLKNVAVSAPDSCINQTAAATTGSAQQAAPILTTRCGVEMAEIERALTRAGYSVTSWLHQHEVVRDERLSATAAARRLGAQVLFQVNSLEKVMVKPGHDVRWERWYEVVADDGPRPVALPEEDRAALRRLAAKDEETIAGAVRLGAMLDVNAIAVDTGQTIWFYRWTKSEPLQEDRTVEFLASYQQKRWFRLESEQRRHNAPKGNARSGEVQVMSSSARPANEDNAVYFQLMRDVISDFAAAFSAGQRSQRPAGDERDPKDRLAQAHREAGEELYRGEQFAQAAAEFEKSLAAAPNPVALSELALCYHAMGQPARALEVLQAYLVRNPDSADRPSIEARIKTLQQDLSAAPRGSNEP